MSSTDEKRRSWFTTNYRHLTSNGALPASLRLSPNSRRVLLIFGPFSFQSVTEFFIGDDGRRFFLRLMNTKDFELIEAFIEHMTVGSSCTL